MKSAAHNRIRHHAKDQLSELNQEVFSLHEEGKTQEAFALYADAIKAVMAHNQRLQQKLLTLQNKDNKSEGVSKKQLEMTFSALALEKKEGEEEDKSSLTEQDQERLDELYEERKAIKKELALLKRKGRRGRRSQRISPKVETKSETSELPEEARLCPNCKSPRQPIGSDSSQRFEYIPGRFTVVKSEATKYACPTCKSGVSVAPLPAKPIARSMASASLLADLVISKYREHLPLNRLQRRYESAGVFLPLSTMTDWVARTAELLEPIAKRIIALAVDSPLGQTDGSGLKVLTPYKKNAPKQILGAMWCLIGKGFEAKSPNDGAIFVGFHFSKDASGAQGPWKLYKDRKGYLQADASGTFDRLYNGKIAKAIEVGCHFHARRGLKALLKQGDDRVATPLAIIKGLFNLEAIAQMRGYDAAKTLEQRHKHAKPFVEKLFAWMHAHSTVDDPASDFTKAINYYINHEKALRRYLEDGRLELSNNFTERQFRDLAIGRRNYLFAGSIEAAKRTAILYSLTRTCVVNHVPEREYLIDVINKLANNWPNSKLDELLPHRWKKLREDK